MNDPIERELALFGAARRLPAAARAAYLDEACAGDAALRQCVEELLQAGDHAGIFLQDPAPGADRRAEVLAGPDVLQQRAAGEQPGDRIGRYKLLEKLGEGGCGLVYMAEQQEPVRRRVALKILKLGMDTRQVIARFEAERQALALMDHPNIARVLEAGATQAGRPYFVMELVRGVRITEFCDKNKVATEERLKLFIQVCHAIQHAHQKGVIHRDIKPSNILVTVREPGSPGCPKVIDFGIAKATAGRLTDQTLFTAFEQFIGTPAYMSPEQAVMTSLDIDTRSDIYSLGVLLYELLAGQTPFDLQRLLEAGREGMRDLFQREEPPRPSTRLSTLDAKEQTTIAEHRQTEPLRLLSLIRGDLDWIVMKSLEKDRARRYQTANALATDIERHLTHEPVVARQPSAVYRFQKLVRRNRVAFATAACVVAALIVGLGIASWRFVREQQAHDRALVAEATAQQRLYDSLLGQARATRLARRMGYREEVFKLLEQARDLHVPQKNFADLRREAVGCLGDFVGFKPTAWPDFPTGHEVNQPTAFHPEANLAALVMSSGAILLRELASGREIAHLAGETNVASICFNSAGDQLFYLFDPVHDVDFGDPTPATPTMAQCLPCLALDVWTRGVDGVWRETENSALPGAWMLLSSTAGVFAVTIDMGSLPDADLPAVPGKLPEMKLGLLDLTTMKAVPGLEFTNCADVRLSPDGQFVAVVVDEMINGREKVFLEIWSFKTGQRLSRQETQFVAQNRLWFSPDGRHLAYLTASGGAIYTVPGLQLIGEFKGHFYSRVCALGNEQVALAVSQQHRIRLWSLIRREDIALLDLPAATLPVVFTPDETSFLADGLKRYWVYRLQTAEALNLPPHAEIVTGVAFSPDGKNLASVGKDRVVRVCDAATGRRLWETNALPGPGQCVAYSPCGRWLVTGDWLTDSLRVWDAVIGKQLAALDGDGEGPTWAVQFSPDGRYLARAGNNGITVWSVESDARGGPENRPAFKFFRSVPAAGRRLAFSPDSRYLALAYVQELRGQYLWDLHGPGPPRLIASNYFGAIQLQSFTPDSRQLLHMNTNCEIVALDVPTGEGTALFAVDEKGARDGIYNLCLSPDRLKLALVSKSLRGVELWDSRLGRLLYPLPDGNGMIYWLAWSPDSQRLAIARDNGEIAIWNLKEIERVVAGLRLQP